VRLVKIAGRLSRLKDLSIQGFGNDAKTGCWGMIGIWVFPKIGVPPNHPLENRGFQYKPSILG